jgi:hypothetical protein
MSESSPESAIAVGDSAVGLRAQVRSLTAHAARLGDCDAQIASLDDADACGAIEDMAVLQRHLDVVRVKIAASIAHRSRPELGHSGLAQREGHRTPEKLIQSITGGTHHEAAKLVATGRMLDEVAAATELATTDPDAAALFALDAVWQQPLAEAVTAGLLSVDGAESIRRGLGVTGPGVSRDALRELAVGFIDDAAVGLCNADDLYRAARRARDQLETDAISRREKEQADCEYLKVHRRPDGMVAGSFLLTPEHGEKVIATLDTQTSPKRGGPTTVDTSRDTPEARRVRSLMDDPRTPEQINAETLITIVDLAVGVDDNTVFGYRKPAVHVIVPATDLDTRTGAGVLEASGEPVSIETVERLICDTGTIPVTIGADGQVLDVGREQRLFTAKQRIGLGVRDGGCRFPGCARPPSWCEAHHVLFWKRDRGRTDIANGILLCRHHHLLVHNNGWDIHRDGGLYTLIPPASVDPDRTPRAMPSRSPHIRAIHDRAVQERAAHAGASQAPASADNDGTRAGGSTTEPLCPDPPADE